MRILDKINIINAVFIFIFVLPLLIGIFRTFSKERVQYSLVSLFDNIELLAGIILSIYLTKKVFFNNKEGIFKKIYGWIPEDIKNVLYGKDVLTYIVAVPLLLLIIMLVLRIVTSPIYRRVVPPLSNIIYNALSSMSSLLRRIISSVSQLPKSIFLILILGLLLNFYSYYNSSTSIAKWTNESNIYQVVYRNALYPVLNSNIAKQIPVILNDSFGKTIGNVIPGRIEINGDSTPEQLAEKFTGENIRVIEYFNGVTLDEAVKSNEAINTKAREIVGNEKMNKKKALLIYKWVSKNIKYDYDKAVKISTDSKEFSSGSITAYNTRTGICFDYSCLYISMCREVGLKVRLITGLGYSGVSWGDHAWNQVYIPEEKRWINVDTTFGSVADYFDKSDFNVDHSYAEVQGEW